MADFNPNVKEFHQNILGMDGDGKIVTQAAQLRILSNSDGSLEYQAGMFIRVFDRSLNKWLAKPVSWNIIGREYYETLSEQYAREGIETSRAKLRKEM